MAVRFQDVERVFTEVVERRREGAPAFSEDDLLAACDGDAALAAEIRALLKHLDEVGDEADGSTSSLATMQGSRFLDPAELQDARVAPAQPALVDGWASSRAGERVGEFTIIEELGAGGMGAVFRAQQERPQRIVALKLLRRQAATPHLVQRFEREAQLLARLNHPGIAQVYAAGVAELTTYVGAAGSVPYIAMELVEGPNLLDFIMCSSSQGTPVELVFRLLEQVCAAVQHAHVRGVIHRDLKPSNILVTTTGDGTPQVKVLDFGVARPDDSVAGEHSELTMHGNIIGTLSYMSPEQMHASNEVDARSDVYSLGVILYRLLAGRLPIDVANSPLAEVARRIEHVEPTPLGSINRSFRGDVEVIARTALEKEPSRRYQSPAELARDLERHLRGEPIGARRDSLVYLLRKRVVRYRAMAMVAALLLSLVIATAIYTRQQQLAAVRSADAAVAAQGKAALSQREAERAAERLTSELIASRIEQARLLGAAGDLTGAEQLLWDEHFVRPADPSVHWALWELYSRSGCLRTIVAHAGDCFAMALTPDGTRLVTGGAESDIRIWSVPDLAPLETVSTGLRSVRAVALSEENGRIVAAGEGGAVIVNPADGSRLMLALDGRSAYGADFDPRSGSVVAIGSDDGRVRLFDVRGALLFATELIAAAPVRSVRYDASGGNLAAAFADGTVRLWRVVGPAEAPTLAPGPGIAGTPGTGGYGVDFSPDGTLLATGSSDRTVALWRVGDGQLVRRWDTRNGSARAVAFSPDGRFVAVPGFWRTALFELQSGEPAKTTPPAFGHGNAYAAMFTRDGRHVLSTGAGGSLRLWEVEATPATVLPATASPVRDLAVRPTAGGLLCAAVRSDGTLTIHRRIAQDHSWTETNRVNVAAGSQTLALSLDGARAFIGRADGHLVSVAPESGVIEHVEAAHNGSLNVVRLSDDGRALVTGGSDDQLHLWDRDVSSAGWDRRLSIPSGGDVISAAFMPDGRLLASSARPGVLHLWRTRDGASLATAALNEPWRLARSRDGRRLAVGSWDRCVHVWNVGDDGALAPVPDLTLSGHSQLVLNQAFDDSGDLLASASSDGTLRLWDVSTGDAQPPHGDAASRRRCLLVLDANAGDSLTVAFLPQGDRLEVAAGYRDGSVRIWNLNYFDRHIEGQREYQRGLRSGPTLREAN